MPPQCHRAVAAQSQTVTAAGGNTHRIGQVRWDVGLAAAVTSPSDDRAVGSQGEAMIISRCQRDYVRCAGRHIG